jgi:hypothetical protein
MKIYYFFNTITFEYCLTSGGYKFLNFSFAFSLDVASSKEKIVDIWILFCSVMQLNLMQTVWYPLAKYIGKLSLNFKTVTKLYMRTFFYLQYNRNKSIPSLSSPFCVVFSFMIDVSFVLFSVLLLVSTFRRKNLIYF